QPQPDRGRAPISRAVAGGRPRGLSPAPRRSAHIFRHARRGGLGPRRAPDGFPRVAHRRRFPRRHGLARRKSPVSARPRAEGRGLTAPEVLPPDPLPAPLETLRQRARSFLLEELLPAERREGVATEGHATPALRRWVRTRAEAAGLFRLAQPVEL